MAVAVPVNVAVTDMGPPLSFSVQGSSVGVPPAVGSWFGSQVMVAVGEMAPMVWCLACSSIRRDGFVHHVVSSVCSANRLTVHWKHPGPVSVTTAVTVEGSGRSWAGSGPSLTRSWPSAE